MRRNWTVPAAAVVGTLLTGIVYLAFANGAAGLGFPLDDAWIHQTYARNLVEIGQWSFIPGIASAGSTAPLWTALISIGYFLKFSPLAWTYLSGLVLLAISAWVAARWFAFRNSEGAKWAWVLAILIPLEWHLAWAALSGMETLALAAISLICFYWLESRRVGIFLVGLLIGGGIWIRPDALTLVLAPVGYLAIRDREKRVMQWLQLGIGMGIPLLAYLAFQRGLSGELMPNTFFAKQAEYAFLRELPLLTRYLMQIGIPGAWLGQAGQQEGGALIGVLIVLIPGLFVAISRTKRRAALIPLAWVGVYLASYAVRLPVTYQHGRYAIPVLPILLMVSFEGMIRWLQPRSPKMAVRVVSRAWVVIAVIVGLAFWAIGARAYARDVAVIESEMVATAHWINDNTPAEAIVAAHDIGAIGYFARRDLIDLAGLISPEVIPIIRDEPALSEYLDSSGASYLVTFPSWYPQLVEGKRLLFATRASYSPALGGENMAVYAWAH